MRSRFASSLRDTEDGTIIMVIDLCEEDDTLRSVTNDAEAVVEEVVRVHGNHPVVYRDTEGRWDELRHTEGRFIGFSPIQNDHWQAATEVL